MLIRIVVAVIACVGIVFGMTGFAAPANINTIPTVITDQSYTANCNGLTDMTVVNPAPVSGSPPSFVEVLLWIPVDNTGALNFDGAIAVVFPVNADLVAGNRVALPCPNVLQIATAAQGFVDPAVNAILPQAAAQALENGSDAHRRFVPEVTYPLIKPHTDATNAVIAT